MRSSWSLLRSQGLGVILGLSTVLLLAAGTLVVAATREGASAGVQMDDVRVFFREPSWVHAWFYLLCGVLTLYALNTTLATWHNVIAKWRLGHRDLKTYAPALFHVAFLVALLAHGVGGLWSEERGARIVGPVWSDLEDGRFARVTSLEVESHPNGQPKQVRAKVEVREGETVREEVVHFNGPLSSGLGSELFLLGQYGELPRGARIAANGTRCEMDLRGHCTVGERDVVLLDVRAGGRMGGMPVARVRALPAEEVNLVPGYPRALADGTSLVLEEILVGPAVVLRVRHAPGNPWALGSALLLLGGVVAMGRRWF